jgi:4-hydroxybenzoate polyprenyltransferase
LTELDILLSTAICFLAFCFISSAVYVTNDIFDAEKDRGHPIKKKRPIASGQIKTGKAVILAAFLFAFGFYIAIAGQDSYLAALFMALYVLVNLAYSFALKHFVIIDCFCIASGFIFRIYAGGAASGSDISEWLFLTMIAVTLFMAFGKRRCEIMQVSDTAKTRKVLASYDLSFLNGIIFCCAGLSVVFYSLWAITGIPAMIYTVPLVIFISCKYLLSVHGDNSHGDPVSVILGDKSLMAAIGVLGLTSVILLYF